MEQVIISEHKLSPLVNQKTIAWLLILTSAFLMIIDNFLKMNTLVGSWHIIMYLLLLTPLAYLAWKRELKNPYTKWFLPFLLIMIIDMFYYNNDMVQFTLPVIFYTIVIILYLTSMHEVHSPYQTLLPRFALPFRGMGIGYIKDFIDSLMLKRGDKKLYGRVGLALLITLPFLGIFTALLFEADRNYRHFLRNLFDFNMGFDLQYLFTIPLYFTMYLLLFIYGLSNHKERTAHDEAKVFDLLIVGIFLSIINLLFASFVTMQIPFLLNTDYLPEYTNVAYYAREGFFQLMMVMGLVTLIFLFILRRYKGESIIRYLLVGLLAQSILIGVVSLKKMHLYQSIKGATVLRYYVEWFDYFLILVLILGIIFLVRKYAFTKLLDIVTLLGIASFTIIVSLNIDAMVATHNIEKFKNIPEKLDKNALRLLSIDALPIIQINEIKLKEKEIFDRERVTAPWYWESKRDYCYSFATYHYGYCSIYKNHVNND